MSEPDVGSPVAADARRTTSSSGTACSASCPGCCGDGVRGSRVVHPQALPATGPTRSATTSADGRVRRRTRSRCRTARTAKTAEVAAYCWEALGQAGFTRSDAVVGVGGGADHRPGRLRGRDLAARRARRARADHAAGHGRRRGRRQDRHQHRRGQEPGRRVPPARRRCSATWPRWRRCRRHDCQRAGRGGQVRLHRRPGDPRPGRGRPGRRSGPRPASCASWSSAAIAVKADVVAADLRERRPVAGRPRDPQLRPHPRPRDRAGRALPLAARRGGRRSAWSSSPSWPGSPAAWTTRLADRHRRPRRSACRSPTPVAWPSSRRDALDKKSRAPAALRHPRRPARPAILRPATPPPLAAGCERTPAIRRRPRLRVRVARPADLARPRLRGVEGRCAAGRAAGDARRHGSSGAPACSGLGQPRCPCSS